MPTVSEAALTAMQRLVDIINTLRSSQPAFLEGASLEALAGSPEAIETLLPYVTEEAYDVMDALRSQRSALSPQPSALSPQPEFNTQHSTLNTLTDPPLPSFTTIDALIPSLLWQIARSDYRLMHLIEGVSGRCWQQGWTTGMVRLVVMLELEAPTVHWCFDLATGHPATGLLESSAIVQTHETALPAEETTHADAANDASDTAYSVRHQLQAILQLLQCETAELGALLQGATVTLLQPGAGWQTGELRLRLGLEFSAQTSDVDSEEEAQSTPEPIEAELMEEGTAIAYASATTPVAVLHTFGRSFSPASLVRASQPALVEHYAQQTMRQQVAQRLYQLQQQPLNHDEGEQHESEQLAIIVQAALNMLAYKTSVTGIGLLQPTLLMDELAPKLLWSLTRSTYEMMQLLGGLTVQVLQPKTHWQPGTLRLLAVLHLAATDRDYTLDLSTGRSVAANAAQLAESTIVQSSVTACQQPLSIETLTAHLQQRWDDAPEYKLLVDGLAVDWLEDVEQNWQTGTMTLKLSLGFFPDAV